jgi:hypothetical protein
MATDGGRATRSAEALNLRQKAARLEIKNNFFSNRVIDNWNLIPSEVKNARTVTSPNHSFKNHRASLVPITYLVEERRLESGWRCGEQRDEDTSWEVPAEPLEVQHQVSSIKFYIQVLYLVMDPSEMLVDNARDGGCEVTQVALLHLVLPVYWKKERWINGWKNSFRPLWKWSVPDIYSAVSQSSMRLKSLYRNLRLKNTFSEWRNSFV